MHKKVFVATVALWLLANLAPAVAAPANHDSAPMLTLPGFVEVGESSVSLVTTSNRARITVKTSDLVSGNVYTLWAFTFSAPGNCDSGCGLDDSATPERRAAVGFAMQQVAGHVTGNSGNVNFGGSIAVENAQGAEYHIVVAEHGALDPENMPEQIKTPHPGVQIGFLGG
jgi:hypothetical protein